MAETVYVQRRASQIVGVYAQRQPGIAEEPVASDHADVVAFRTPRRTPDAISYRRQREPAYMRDLAKPEETEPTYTRTLGDVLDAALAQIETNRIASGAVRTEDFDRIITAVAAVKARFPKP